MSDNNNNNNNNNSGSNNNNNKDIALKIQQPTLHKYDTSDVNERHNYNGDFDFVFGLVNDNIKINNNNNNNSKKDIVYHRWEKSGNDDLLNDYNRTPIDYKSLHNNNINKMYSVKEFMNYKPPEPTFSYVGKVSTESGDTVAIVPDPNYPHRVTMDNNTNIDILAGDKVEFDYEMKVKFVFRNGIQIWPSLF